MKKLIAVVTIVIMVIFSNIMAVSVTVAVTTVSSAEKTNRYKRHFTPEPRPGPSWRSDDLQSLEDVILKKNLGIINDKLTSRNILNRLQQWNSNILLEELYVSNISYNSAIIRPLPSSVHYLADSSCMIYFKSDTANDLAKIISNVELVSLSRFTQDGILDCVKELNPQLDIEQLYVDGIRENSAIVKPLPNSLYRGYASVFFEKKRPIYFSRQKIENNLGEISACNPRTILTRLQELNQNSIVNIDELYVQNITIVGATIKVMPNSKIYHHKDSIEVSYIMPFLSSLIINRNLGCIENDEQDNILKVLLSLNPGINIQELSVENITSSSAVIVPRITLSNSIIRYEGQVTVTFFVEKRRLFLGRIVLNTNLGINSHPNEINPQIILETVKKINIGVDITQLVVQNIYNNEYAIIRARINSKIYWGQVTVQMTYRNSRVLSSVITKTDLSMLPDNSAATILNFVYSKNPDVNLNQIYVTRIEENYAIINVLPNSLIYFGEVIVYFNLWRLNDVLTDLDLGEISDNSPRTILDRLGELNRTIYIDELGVENITDTSAEIVIRTFSFHFKMEGKIIVTFKPKIKIIILDDIIKHIMLGYLSSNNAQFILVRVQELNPEVDITQLYVSNSTDNRAIIRARSDSNNYIGDVVVYFSLRRTRTGISNVIPNNYLGQIDNLLSQTIMRQLILLNSEVDSNQIEIVNISSNNAIVRTRWNSTVYHGETFIYFNINANNSNLETFIPVEHLNLGPISDSLPETILAHLHAANLGLDVTQLSVQNITSNSAEILAQTNSIAYTGHVTVYFNISPIFYQLNNVIVQTELGEISENTPIAILTRVQELNPGIVVDQLSIQNITSNSAVVVPIAGSTLYEGQVTVNFNVSLPRDLEFEWINTFLGEPSEINSAMIFSTFSELNPDIDVTQFDVTDITTNGATLKPTPFSIYKNEVQVTFETRNHKIKPDYPDEFAINNKENSDETKILNLTLSKKVFHKIVRVFFKKKQVNAVQEINEILKIQTKIKNKKIAILATLIWKHFSYYYELYNTLSENQSVLIQTNADGYWDKEDPWTHNKVVGEDKGYKNKNFLTKTLDDMDDYNKIKDGECLKEFADSYDVLEGYYAINWFKLRIRFETLLYIKYLFYINNKDIFIDKLSKLLYSFSQTNNSNFKTYAVSKTDICNTAYMIWEHFPYYQNSLYFMNKGQSLVIENKSGTEKGYWNDSNPWIYNKIVGEKVTHNIKNNTNSVLSILNKENLFLNQNSFDNQNKIYDLYYGLLRLKQSIINC